MTLVSEEINFKLERCLPAYGGDYFCTSTLATDIYKSEPTLPVAKFLYQ